jgi:hypothetical protein
MINFLGNLSTVVNCAFSVFKTFHGKSTFSPGNAQIGQKLCPARRDMMPSFVGGKAGTSIYCSPFEANLSISEADLTIQS